MTPNEHKKRLVAIRVKNLHALREEQGLTQSRLAAKLGVTPAALSQYFSGHRSLGRAFCSRVEEVMGLSQGDMDLENMSIPLVAPKPPTSLLAERAPLLDTAGLSNLHLGVMDTFAKAARSGNITDEYCAELISNLLIIRTSGGDGSCAK